MPSRCFPLPWTIEEFRGISTSSATPTTSPSPTYFELEPGRRAAANLTTEDEARKIAAGIAKLPELLMRPSE